jgi:hypothetical protein
MSTTDAGTAAEGTGTLSGRVSTADRDDAVYPCVVEATRSSPPYQRAVPTSHQGFYAMTLPAGRYTVVIASPDHPIQRRLVDIAEGSETRLDVAL